MPPPGLYAHAAEVTSRALPAPIVTGRDSQLTCFAIRIDSRIRTLTFNLTVLMITFGFKGGK
jgi:hypothetical protein